LLRIRVELCDNCGQQYCDNSNCSGICVSPGIITLNGVVKWFPRYFKFVNGLLEIPKDIDGNFDTPQEAYSAAFDYILTNLI
jgi:hypothetical protein